jgi:hypothetical protein
MVDFNMYLRQGADRKNYDILKEIDEPLLNAILHFGSVDGPIREASPATRKKVENFCIRLAVELKTQLVPFEED